MPRYHILVRNRILRCLIGVSLLALGCSSKDKPQATIVIVAGQEADAFSRKPVPDHLTVRSVDLDGRATDLVTVGWPTDSFDIGDLSQSGVAAIQVSIEDSASDPLLRGQTVYYSLWTLEGYDVPVFVGRVGELSRPPGSFSFSRRNALVGVVGAQYLVVTGGADTKDAAGSSVSPASLDAYDLAAWDAVPVSVTLPRAPTAMPIVLGQYALIIDDAGATWFDFGTDEQTQATPPDGMSFADVSNGQVVYAPDGAAYVVGGTRTTAESDVVLRIGTDFALSLRRLSAPRLGACAMWVPDVGLVVAGGSATAAGAEILASDASVSTALGYPPDPTVGAGIVALDDARILMAGGLDPSSVGGAATRTLDLSCTGACKAETIEATPPLPLAGARAFRITEQRVLLVGEEQAAGATRTAVYEIAGLGGTPTIMEVGLREPRTGATAVALMGNMVGVLGGLDASGAAVRSLEVYPGR